MNIFGGQFLERINLESKHDYQNCCSLSLILGGNLVQDMLAFFKNLHRMECFCTSRISCGLSSLISMLTGMFGNVLNTSSSRAIFLSVPLSFSWPEGQYDVES